MVAYGWIRFQVSNISIHKISRSINQPQVIRQGAVDAIYDKLASVRLGDALNVRMKLSVVIMRIGGQYVESFNWGGLQFFK